MISYMGSTDTTRPVIIMYLSVFHIYSHCLFLLSVFLRSGREAAVFSARAGSVLVTLKAQHQAASIQAVEMNSQYFLLFCR